MSEQTAKWPVPELSAGLDRYVCGYVIDFADGAESEEQIIHVGSLDECERVGDMLPGVAYSGDRQVSGARFVIVKHDV